MIVSHDNREALGVLEMTTARIRELRDCAEALRRALNTGERKEEALALARRTMGTGSA